ncbi:hypothetical protein FOZ60_002135 [Perkinsus olseni]|uniref:START domain-containing protein n=3 Tax=Perkinsus olseni TaxID=32597 RepID=A0A7J6NYU6_PEROL|nr:hypothetical protein FOZ60_002135 [Perkinsus olseni]
MDMLYRLGKPSVRQKLMLGMAVGAVVVHEVWKDSKKANVNKGRMEGVSGAVEDGSDEHHGNPGPASAVADQHQEEAEAPQSSLLKAPVHMSFLPTWQLVPWPTKDTLLPPSAAVALPSEKILIPVDPFDKYAAATVEEAHASPATPTHSENPDTQVSTMDQSMTADLSLGSGEGNEAEVPAAAVHEASSGRLDEEFRVPAGLALPPRVKSLLGDALSLVSDEMDADPDAFLAASGWQKFGYLEKDGQYTCTIWRKELMTEGGKRSPTPQWMMTGDIAVAPAQFHALNVDIDNRPSWDATFEGARKEDEGEDGSSTLVWKSKWPWPFSPRLYRYRQIPLVLPASDTRAMLSLGLQEAGRKDDSSVRVTDYISLSCVKPNTPRQESSALQSRYCLYYYEDPRVGTSMPAWLERHVAESTLPKMVSNIVSAVSKYPPERLEKYKDVGLLKTGSSAASCTGGSLTGKKKEHDGAVSTVRVEDNTSPAKATTEEHPKRRRPPPYATPIVCQWFPTSSGSCKEDARLLTCPFVFTPLDVVVRLYEGL